jgi:hypothetical protein
MANLAFIRNMVCFDCWDYFECKTDVWLFGDVEGYTFFERQIRLAVFSEKNIHLSLTEKHPTSMRAVLVHASKNDQAPARLKFIERVVCDTRDLNMELVICGNNLGLTYLAEQVARITREYAGNPSEHTHLDDADNPHVAARSVSLNIRGPFDRWTRESFGEYTELILKKNEHFLPVHGCVADETPRPYEEIRPEESDFFIL